MKFGYICDCYKPELKYNYSYWENKKTTTDELDIINYLETKNNIYNKKILHIGIGNSYLCNRLPSSNKIYGISISNNEIINAQNINKKNYIVYYCDKYSKNFNLIFKELSFDLIIDTNLKSYSCCEKSFKFMFENYINKLNKNGILITSRKGMSWCKRLKPSLSFSLKKLFYYKLKEIDGDESNILQIDEMKYFSKLYSLDCHYDDKVCCLKK